MPVPPGSRSHSPHTEPLTLLNTSLPSLYLEETISPQEPSGRHDPKGCISLQLAEASSHLSGGGGVEENP